MNYLLLSQILNNKYLKTIIFNNLYLDLKRDVNLNLKIYKWRKLIKNSHQLIKYGYLDQLIKTLDQLEIKYSKYKWLYSSNQNDNNDNSSNKYIPNLKSIIKVAIDSGRLDIVQMLDKRYRHIPTLFHSFYVHLMTSGAKANSIFQYLYQEKRIEDDPVLLKRLITPSNRYNHFYYEYDTMNVVSKSTIAQFKLVVDDLDLKIRDNYIYFTFKNIADSAVDTAEKLQYLHSKIIDNSDINNNNGYKLDDEVLGKLVQKGCFKGIKYVLENNTGTSFSAPTFVTSLILRGDCDSLECLYKYNTDWFTTVQKWMYTFPSFFPNLKILQCVESLIGETKLIQFLSRTNKINDFLFKSPFDVIQYCFEKRYIELTPTIRECSLCTGQLQLQQQHFDIKLLEIYKSIFEYIPVDEVEQHIVYIIKRCCDNKLERVEPLAMAFHNFKQLFQEILVKRSLAFNRNNFETKSMKYILTMLDSDVVSKLLEFSTSLELISSVVESNIHIKPLDLFNKIVNWDQYFISLNHYPLIRYLKIKSNIDIKGFDDYLEIMHFDGIKSVNYLIENNLLYPFKIIENSNNNSNIYENQRYPTKKDFKWAIKQSYLTTLKYLVRINHNKIVPVKDLEKVVRKTTRFQIIHYLYKQFGYNVQYLTIYKKYYLYSLFNHIESSFKIIKFILKHSQYHYSIPSMIIDRITCTERNSLKMLMVIHEYGLMYQPITFSESIMDKMALCGNFDAVQFLHFNRSEGCSPLALDNAISKAQYEIAEFLIQYRTEGHFNGQFEPGLNQFIIDHPNLILKLNELARKPSKKDKIIQNTISLLYY